MGWQKQDVVEQCTVSRKISLVSGLSTELLFDRVGEIARERTELHRNKTGLELEKEKLAEEEKEFEEGSKEKLLSLANK
jgi:hypothetical protein